MTTPFDEEERANRLQQIAILKARLLPGSNRDIAHEEEGSACTTDKILFVIATWRISRIDLHMGVAEAPSCNGIERSDRDTLTDTKILT
jgi:hypothetical protein